MWRSISTNTNLSRGTTNNVLTEVVIIRGVDLSVQCVNSYKVFFAAKISRLTRKKKCFGHIPVLFFHKIENNININLHFIQISLIRLFEFLRLNFDAGYYFIYTRHHELWFLFLSYNIYHHATVYNIIL